MSHQQSQLVFYGALLFLLGLLQGFLIPVHHNPRLGLSAHLAAMQSGMAVMLFGLVWPYTNVSERLGRLAVPALITGMYLVWIAISIAAATGANATLPIAGGPPTQGLGALNAVVGALIGLGSLLATTGVAIFTLGLGRNVLR